MWPHGLYSPWNSLGQNTGMGSLSLLQGIFPTQGSNPGLSYCRWILYQLSYQESPRILEWVAYPFASGYSWPRNQTGFSCIAGRFFTNWATRESLVARGQYSEWRCSLSPCPEGENAINVCRQMGGECLEKHSTAAIPDSTFPAAIVRVVVKTVYLNVPILGTHFLKKCLNMRILSIP